MTLQQDQIVATTDPATETAEPMTNHVSNEATHTCDEHRAKSTKTQRLNNNILSWNIHDSATIQGEKIGDASFLSIINKSDIFCLQETKERSKFLTSDVSIPIE